MATRTSTERLLFLIIIVLLSLTSLSKAIGTKYVTCGSVLKLLNVAYHVRLHSHDIKYGSGSGQQSVTGTETKEDVNSHWMVKGVTGKYCTRGEPIACGDVIRLEHVPTKKNLHSHHVSSPLSGKQEVSAYGDQKGEGDSGDHWSVICDSDYWERNKSVMLHHVDTKTFLAASGRTYGSPIAGQMEIVGDSSSGSDYTRWQVVDGLFIHTQDLKSLHHPHTEL
ncbi:stromal cell-derived factor 2 [Fopius arisanus]|uniref:Stromal cell-derived factor 2 n=1 Tax=Fopius arisanus TaxID=64838 RepID=A0A9R1STV7_9HYME|nr:PREDICTED: stromal cell-derived factor 2 [Fopius arisanus]